MNEKLRITLSISNNYFFRRGKRIEFLGVIDITKTELDKHKNQRLVLIINKLSDYILRNAKDERVLSRYLNNINYVEYTSQDGIKIDLLNK